MKFPVLLPLLAFVLHAQRSRSRFEAAASASLHAAKVELDAMMVPSPQEAAAARRKLKESRISGDGEAVLEAKNARLMSAAMDAVSNDVGGQGGARSAGSAFTFGGKLSSDSEGADYSSDFDSDGGGGGGRSGRGTSDERRRMARRLALQELRAHVRAVASQFETLRTRHAATLERLAGAGHDLLQARRHLAEKEEELEKLTRNGDPRKHEQAAQKLFQANQDLLRKLHRYARDEFGAAAVA